MSDIIDVEDESEKPVKGKFRPETCDQAYELYLLGKTDEEVAKFFKVSLTTIHRWAFERLEFRDARDRGKDIADGHVARSLYNNATGYYYTKTVVSNSKDGPVLTRIQEYVPPETKAAEIWLKMRQGEHWNKKPPEAAGATGKEQQSLLELARSMLFFGELGAKELGKMTIDQPKDAVLIEQKKEVE